MKLASLHQDFSFNLVTKAFKSELFLSCLPPIRPENIKTDATIPSSVFWTSGTDLGCEGNYGYCSTKRLLRSEARLNAILFGANTHNKLFN